MIGNKIKELRKSHKMTLEELADNLNKKYPNTINFNKGKISKWENNKEEPRLSSVKILADFFNVSLDYFNDEEKEQPQILSIYNQLEQPRQEKVLDFAKEQLEEQNKVVSTHEELFSIQGVTYAAAASGFGRGFEADEYDTYTVYTDEEPPHYDYAIGVRGDSMLPKYEQGDMLYIVDRGMSAYAGQLCIVVHNGQTYFKKVYTEEDGLRLVSLNKKYNDIFIDYPPAEDTYIKIYDVVGSFTPVEI
ncbi:XRE family transcriptional regulator [Streptococcus equi]|uniref:XRE family transcriptional regulator n=2 Tax=Streptococcus equi TaxID=1336 RepID=UPI001BDF668B|nr:XRE family transcriptional regulator [Streptococcus equi]MBT1194115.1 helix-turn-helix transcriptional regulator [Streptococcus equi subsp. equi]